MRSVTLLIALLCIVACGEPKIIPQGGEVVSEELPVRLEGIHLTVHSEHGLPERTVQAERADVYLDSQRAALENLVLEFRQGNQPQYEFRAEGRTEHIKITRHDNNEMIYARTFNFRAADDALFTEDPFIRVEVSESGGSAVVTEGEGLLTDPSMEQTEIRRFSIHSVPSFDAAEFDRLNRPLPEEETP
jgi:hypothetical protein